MTSAIREHHRGRAEETHSGGEMLILIFHPAPGGFTFAPCLSRPLLCSARRTRVSCSR